MLQYAAAFGRFPANFSALSDKLKTDSGLKFRILYKMNRTDSEEIFWLGNLQD